MNRAMHLSAIPPRTWLVHSLLIYDQVQVVSTDLDINWSRDVSTWGIDVEDLKYLQNLTTDERMQQVIVGDMILNGDAIQLAAQHAEITPEAYLHLLVDAMMNIAAKKHLGLSNDELNVFVDIVNNIFNNCDFHVPWSTPTPNSSTGHFIVQTLEHLVPIDPNAISKSQIVDFRMQNELRRFKFQNTADALVKSFSDASTEEDVKRVLRLIEQELQEQYQKLEMIYRHTRIEAAARTVATVGGPPALLGVLGSVLGISSVEAAGFVASAALSVVPWLIAKEKADMAVNDSPWAYLWHMKNEFR